MAAGHFRRAASLHAATRRDLLSLFRALATAGVRSIAVHLATFRSEVNRTGFDGHWEAAIATGLDVLTTFEDIVLPQAIRLVLLASNYLVSIFKDTPLLSAIEIK
ncbi:hypothetical protein [Bradyrhizobium tunisiense]|uniref:hypothetical protein n=1 Tax=Bradyrhizobium tunisiense TaxID=3278709 RepID=UPI0035E121B0